EDGIRDATVTGVQTCALPILLLSFGAMFIYESIVAPNVVSAPDIQRQTKSEVVKADHGSLQTGGDAEQTLHSAVPTQLPNIGTQIGRASCREREKTEEMEVDA